MDHKNMNLVIQLRDLISRKFEAMESDADDLEVIYESHLPATTSTTTGRSTTTTPNKSQRTRKKSLEKVGLFPKLDDDPAKIESAEPNESPNNEVPQHECIYCSKLLFHLSSLNRHIKNIHKVESTPANNVQRQLPQQQPLQRKATTIVTEFKCKTCGRVFDSNKILGLHRTFVHNETEVEPVEQIKPIQMTPVVSAEEVNNEFSETSSEDEEEDQNQFKCGSCSRMFYNNTQLIRHIRKRHDKRRNDDPASTADKYSITTVHINASSLKLTFKRTLVRHHHQESPPEDSDHSYSKSPPRIAEAGYSIVRCGECGDSFSDYTDLIEHVQDNHLNLKDRSSDNEVDESGANTSDGNESDEDLPLSKLLSKLKSNKSAQHRKTVCEPSRSKNLESEDIVIAPSENLSVTNGVEDDYSDEEALSTAKKCLTATDHVLDAIDEQLLSKAKFRAGPASRKNKKEPETSSGIKCGECRERFNDYLGLMEHVENEHLNEAGNVSSSNKSPGESNSSSKPNDCLPTASSPPEQNLSESSTNNPDDDSEIKVVLESLECIKNQKINGSLRKQKMKTKSTEVPNHLKKKSGDSEAQSKSTELVITPMQSPVLLKQASNLPELRSRDKEISQKTSDQQSHNQFRDETTVATDISIDLVLQKNSDFAPELRSHSKIPTGLPKIPTVVATGPAVRCGDCGDSFVDYLELMEHVEDVHLPAVNNDPPVQASNQKLKRKIGPKSKANKRQKIDSVKTATNSVASISTEKQTLGAHSSAALQIFKSSLLSTKDKVPSKGVIETRMQSSTSTSPTQQLETGLTDHDKSVEQVKIPSLKRLADDTQVLTPSKRPTRQSSSSSLIADSNLPTNNPLLEESATHLSAELNKSSTTNQKQKKVIHEAVPLLPCYISVKTPDRETPLTCGCCALKFQFEKDILRHAERLHSHNFEDEETQEDFNVDESMNSGVKSCETSQLVNEVQQRIGSIEKLISKSKDKSPRNLFPKCSQCGDIFLDNSYLEEHLRNIHQAQKDSNVKNETTETVVKKKRGRKPKNFILDVPTSDVTLPNDVIILDCPECEDRFFEAIHLEEHVSHKHRPLLKQEEPKNTRDVTENTRDVTKNSWDVTEKVVNRKGLTNGDKQIESKQQLAAKVVMPIISTRKTVSGSKTGEIPQNNKFPVLTKPCSVVLRRISLGKGTVNGLNKGGKDMITKAVDGILPISPTIREVLQITSKANPPNVITLTPAKVKNADITFLTPPKSNQDLTMSGIKKSMVRLVPLEKLITSDNRISNERNIKFKDIFTPIKSFQQESYTTQSTLDNQVMTKVHPDFKALINSLTLKTEKEEFSVKCGSCSEEFIDTNQLIIHMERDHSNPSNLQTPRKSLSKQSDHGDNDNINKMGKAIEENKKSDQKNYLCLDCDRTFYTRAYLERHTKLKHASRPF